MAEARPRRLSPSHFLTGLPVSFATQAASAFAPAAHNTITSEDQTVERRSFHLARRVRRQAPVPDARRRVARRRHRRTPLPWLGSRSSRVPPTSRPRINMILSCRIRPSEGGWRRSAPNAEQPEISTLSACAYMERTEPARCRPTTRYAHGRRAGTSTAQRRHRQARREGKRRGDSGEAGGLQQLGAGAARSRALTPAFELRPDC